MSHDRNPNNRLRDETSPYLLQHAGNPVDWHPWNDGALERARQEDKPILLSIGYSACHWCHVMAHESFEDPATAGVMNEKFINIKVDREERPDLDKIYQLSHQLLTRRPGGWPLTVFLDPHTHLPFFAGTYFPRTPRFNLPSFVTVLERVADYYHNRPGDLQQNQRALQEVLQGFAEPPSAFGEFDPAMLEHVERVLAEAFDPRYGGFGDAPKFPHTSDLEFLYDRWLLSDKADRRPLEIVTTTLERMARGGIYDQLGGGFYRYSVDAHWEIPHFEKMLYDNGPLLALYAKAGRIEGNPLFERVTEETAGWLMREMQSAEGGFFSSLDADSEGQEGKYYLWHRQAVRALVSSEEYPVVQRLYGLDETPNFEGQWHLRLAVVPEAIAADLSLSVAELSRRLALARRKMLAEREKRPRPSRDDKILVAWNALAIRGMSIAGRLYRREDWTACAFRAAEFLRQRCWLDGRLRATYTDGQARFNAYLDDYAMLLDACLALLETRWQNDLLQWALALADCLLEHFRDPQGGFFFTSDDHERLIHRPKPWMDESLPSGNGVAASALHRLGLLVGDARYRQAAEACLRSAMPSLQRYPQAHGALLSALQEWLHPPRIVILRGDPAVLIPWREALEPAANTLGFIIPPTENRLPGLLAERRPEGDAVAYVCTETACLPPIRDLAALQEALRPG